MNRNVHGRHVTIVRAVAFMMRYYELSEKSPRASYNVGRAFHQLDLTHFAIPYYEKALAGAGPALNDEHYELRQSEHVIMRRFAAHNLMLIYKASGQEDRAREILYEYLVI
eukprot:TRINITY_DN1423_c0_g1_i2.p1 TRINITY_DN1423_c0_g1~~TRINITY_DN1423_c0_g1_i2.p1  ORF type:complete len:111 (-),score=36.69 TRINITY_DN1423_c0_g1_i2:490-822(-)